MNIEFQGKRALVTGAGKGIGRAVAKRLVELGAETYALSRTQSDLNTFKEEVPSVNIVQCDLTDWCKTREVVGSIKDIDLLVNNAGVSTIHPFLEFEEKDIDWTFGVNYKAVFNVSQVVAGDMVTRGCAGSIVNVSSAASTFTLRDHAVYCSTKAAVDMLTKVMALELGPYKIRVNAINPTAVLTDMGKRAWSDPVKSGPLLDRTPLGRFLELSEFIDATMFLLSDKASMVHGIAMPVDGGLLTS